jgi:hypothetical protein
MEHISCDALMDEKHESPSKVCLQVNTKKKNYVLVQQSIDIFENDEVKVKSPFLKKVTTE